jgi:hypothetical protein
LPDQWNESIIVLVYKKDDKTGCSNYREILLLLAAYNVLSNSFLLRLSQYVVEIIIDHHYGLRCNGSTIYEIFCIRQILEKTWTCNDLVHQIFIGPKKAYYPVRREVLYNILIEFGVTM